MHWIDILIFCAYLLAMLGVGFYFLKKNKTTHDYYVGGRNLTSFHIGLSVVATDVGGDGVFFFQYHNAQAGVLLCQMQRCGQADNARADDGDINLLGVWHSGVYFR